MQGPIKLLYSLLILSLVFTCNQNKEQKMKTINKSDSLKTKVIPYDLTDPYEIFELPGKLDEISGIDFYKPGIIACHNDEDGEIFLFDIEKRKLEEKYKFAGDGDYEDIVIDGETAFILRSDGKIYEVKDFTSKKSKTKEIKTPLSRKNDAEGLCYDKKNKYFLIACKETAEIRKEKKIKGKKAIYKFSILKDTLIGEPLLIDLKQLEKLHEVSAYEKFSRKMADKLTSSSGSGIFKPSAVAIHPQSGEIYVLASVGKKIVVIDKKANILAIENLSSKIFAQPEGICFDQDTNLYISNESKGKKANILKFNYKK